MLERKYGGIEARKAAIVIQRAFRKYQLNQKFATLASVALKLTKEKSSNSSLMLFKQQQRFSSSSLESSSSSSNGSIIKSHPVERGIQYLIEENFIESTNLNDCELAENIANFLLTRKGLSKQMIGEYLGNIQSKFQQLVLKYFTRLIDFKLLEVDEALRKFQTNFRFPGEAQKIEKIIEMFAHTYYDQNKSYLVDLMSRDDVFILSFAIIMLNTDLHTPNNKHRMTKDQWFKNINSILKNSDKLQKLLNSIYDRIKLNEFKTGADHCSHVLKVQQSLVYQSKHQNPINLCLTWRRLVCFCRLYEIIDLNKKESAHKHQREIFLFNDLLLITKLTSKKSNSTSTCPT
ncbi:IQ motif and SEC7 domain-containing protein 1-like protein [Leptotrombidium deliense]|uniref:IQ motif and SEC7 domain-containing protein 1-like protein n=1 Tax=Leptotrombidium deliense TaxID=299467 RepID=A0A443SWG2_9ACAR|nr:IQ motif and SEC7 domain-containing protein 1-like protein [Leptotrombidium deliense]